MGARHPSPRCSGSPSAVGDLVADLMCKVRRALRRCECWVACPSPDSFGAVAHPMRDTGSNRCSLGLLTSQRSEDGVKHYYIYLKKNTIFWCCVGLNYSAKSRTPLCHAADCLACLPSTSEPDLFLGVGLSKLVCGIVCWCSVQGVTLIVGVSLGFVSVRALPKVFSLAGTMVLHFVDVKSKITPKNGAKKIFPFLTSGSSGWSYASRP